MMASVMSRNGGGVVESGLLHLAHQLRLAYRALSRNNILLLIRYLKGAAIEQQEASKNSPWQA